MGSIRLLATLLATLGVLSWAPSGAFGETGPATSSDGHGDNIKRYYSLDWDSAPKALTEFPSAGGVAPVGPLPGIAPPTGVKPPNVIQASPSPVLNVPQGGKTLYFGQIYGQRVIDGQIKLVGCNIEIYTSTPAPTRTITYGLGLQCNRTDVRGTGIAHLGEYPNIRALGAGSEFNINRNGGGQFEYSPYQRWDRESETQLQRVYAYFSLTIDGLDNVDGWLTAPTAGGAADTVRCSSTLKRNLTCEIITTGYPFVLDDNFSCTSGEVCSLAKSVTDTANRVVADVQRTADASLAEARAIQERLTDEEGVEQEAITLDNVAFTRRPHCIGQNEPGLTVVYMRPSDQPSTARASAPVIRRIIGQANARVFADARISSNGRVGADLRVQCNGRGLLAIGSVRSDVSAASRFDLQAVGRNLRAAGYAATNRKYLVFWDGLAPEDDLGGIAQIPSRDGQTDSLPGPQSVNNTGGQYGTVYRTTPNGNGTGWTFRVALHEASHMMGAVQRDATNSTSFFHCTDGADIMCYDDKSPEAKGFSESRCTTANDNFPGDRTGPYDCGFDDYFNAGEPTAPTNYLSNHWNIGDKDHNAYLQFSVAAGARTAIRARIVNSAPTPAGGSRPPATQRSPLPRGTSRERYVPGIGRARRLPNGLFVIKDGNRLILTHGPDPALK